MNRRERSLVIVGGALLGVGLAYMIANRLVLAPIRRYAAEEDGLVNQIEKLEGQAAVLSRQKAAFASLRDRTYDDDIEKAGVSVRLRMDQIARQAGLSQNSISVSPVSRPGTRTKFGEVGCTVSGTASLERLTNFLFLLNHDRYLHRITSLDVIPQKDRRTFTFKLRYVSPVFDRKPPVTIAARQAPTTQMTELASLSHPDRSPYDVIATRNIFQPYRPPRRVAPPRRRGPPRRPEPPRPPPVKAPDPLDSMIVSALPSSNGVPEVHVQVPGLDMAKVFKIGEKLPIGVIAMVDYRVIPMPGDPKQLSKSRVIVRQGKDYRAVEHKQPLSRWRALRPDELPDELKPQPARPSTQPAKKT